jgi:hypothetical protein
MPQNLVGAEVVPQTGKSVEAAKLLQDHGFKVLHVGKTSVSVQGSEAVWQKHFSVAFESCSKQLHHPAIGPAVSYRRPIHEPISIPPGLEEWIESVAFVEPPEFFGPVGQP